MSGETHSFKHFKGGFMQTVDIAKAILKEVLSEEGFILYQIYMGTHQSSPVLKIEIDSKNGVSIDDCTRFLEIVDQYLESHDSDYEKYQIEMSSAGAERPLRNIEEIIDSVGRYVYIRTESKIDKQTEFFGTINGVENDNINFSYIVRNKEKNVDIPYDIIQIIRLAVKF